MLLYMVLLTSSSCIAIADCILFKKLLFSKKIIQQLSHYDDEITIVIDFNSYNTVHKIVQQLLVLLQISNSKAIMAVCAWKVTKNAASL